MKLAFISCHVCYICLGDLGRYKEELQPVPDWSSVRRWVVVCVCVCVCSHARVCAYLHVWHLYVHVFTCACWWCMTSGWSDPQGDDWICSSWLDYYVMVFPALFPMPKVLIAYDNACSSLVGLLTSPSYLAFFNMQGGDLICRLLTCRDCAFCSAWKQLWNTGMSQQQALAGCNWRLVILACACLLLHTYQNLLWIYHGGLLRPHLTDMS